MDALTCTARTGPRRCPLCHDDLAAAERVACARCGAAHHRGCTRLPPRCASCGAALVVPRRARWPRVGARRVAFVLASGTAPWWLLLVAALTAPDVPREPDASALTVRLSVAHEVRERREAPEAPALAELRTVECPPGCPWCVSELVGVACCPVTPEARSPALDALCEPVLAATRGESGRSRRARGTPTRPRE